MGHKSLSKNRELPSAQKTPTGLLSANSGLGQAPGLLMAAPISLLPAGAALGSLGGLFSPCEAKFKPDQMKTRTPDLLPSVC